LKGSTKAGPLATVSSPKSSNKCSVIIPKHFRMQPQIANVPTERGMPDNNNSWAELGGKVRDTGNASNMPW
jgi:hypothetical protein